MPYQPVENYGLIGNLRAAALVGMDGSIDWLRLPHFDSPSVFAGLLDDQKGGRFCIEPKTGLAIGYADPETLPEKYRSRDLTPRTQKPRAECVFAGEWGSASGLPKQHAGMQLKPPAMRGAE